jgi:hypothetical protein
VPSKIEGNLISGYYQEYAGSDYPILQTMAGVDIDVDFDEFQEWYKAFTAFPKLAIQSSTNTLKVETGPIARSRVTSMAQSVT